MNIYIDTNILLSFYHLSSDDLEELKKLGVLLRQKKVTLWLPEQTVIEFKRNRANKIADALKRLDEQHINMQFPQLSKEYDEYPLLKNQLRDAEKNYSILLQNIRKDVMNENLKADHTIQELISLAAVIPTTHGIVEQARFRFDIGNPPGKKDSLGDAINWTSLLETLPSNEDLFFISDDKDYCSALDNDLFNPFLLNEWKERKGKEVCFYKRLSSFFKDKFPDIKLASELEKDLTIRELVNSPSFFDTHRIIGRLSTYTDFSPVQANEIAMASVTNSQVSWIIEDEDVKEFLTRIVNDYSTQVDSVYMSSLAKHLKDLEKTDTDSQLSGEIPDDEIPF